MSVIPRPVKRPARTLLSCKLMVDLAALVKHYAEFIDSTQEYVVTEALRRVFDRDKEFQVWLATTHPTSPLAEPESPKRPVDKPHPTPATSLQVGTRQERLGS